MCLQVVIPSSLPSLRAWLDVLVLQNVLDRLSADTRDAQTAEFSEDLRVAEPGLSSDLEHEVTKDLALASRLTYGGLAAFRFPSPAIESTRSHDRDQFLDRSTERQTKLKKPVTFFTASVNLPRDPRTKDLVLFLQITDLAPEMRVGSTGDQGQQRMKQLGHGSSLV